MRLRFRSLRIWIAIHPQKLARSALFGNWFRVSFVGFERAAHISAAAFGYIFPGIALLVDGGRTETAGAWTGSAINFASKSNAETSVFRARCFSSSSRQRNGCSRGESAGCSDGFDESVSHKFFLFGMGVYDEPVCSGSLLHSPKIGKRLQKNIKLLLRVD